MLVNQEIPDACKGKFEAKQPALQGEWFSGFAH
jgi:hypothetical protein